LAVKAVSDGKLVIDEYDSSFNDGLHGLNGGCRKSSLIPFPTGK